MANVVAKLEITMMDTGEIKVSGPIDNKLFAYGLLEIAKETVKEHCEAAARLVQPAPAGLAAQLNTAQFGGKR